MRVHRIVVGRGKTSRPTEQEEWVRNYYEVEALLDEGEDPVAARLGLEYILEQWLQGKTTGLEEIPKLDPADLDALPWLTYKNKELAEPGHSGWLKNPAYFSNFDNPVAAELAKALTRTGGKLELGEYVYSFSGKERQFLSRKPVRKPTAEEESQPKENPHEKMDRNLRNVHEAGRRLTE